MATLCRNCNHALIYSPEIRKVYCTYCGSAFEAEEVESEAKKYRENERVLTRGEVYGDDEVIDEFLEAYVYTCSECGGEIKIHGTETSTTCIYCGNPNVVFSRVAKDKMPDAIIPFTVPRAQALNSIRTIIDQAAFPPAELKNLKVEDIRGIYLPYWVVSATHEETAVVQIAVSSGTTKYKYVGRTGFMNINSFPVDGCRILSDESSSRLEPFDLNGMKRFDEDYLLGFYSNSSDISYDELYLAVERRGKEIFETTLKKEMKSTKIVGEVHETSIADNYLYAMFPVWFVTFCLNGQPHTILVNGQTGKVVCGIPYDRKKVRRTMIFWGTLITAVGVGVLYGILYALGFRELGKKSVLSGTCDFVLSASLIFGTGWLLYGLDRMKKVKKQLERTQAENMFRFVKRRQG